MGEVLDRMDGDLRLRGLSEVTRIEYLRRVGHFVAHYHVLPEQLGAEDVRRYMLHLVDDLHIGPANLKTHIAAIKFLYNVTLDRPEVVATSEVPQGAGRAARYPEPHRGGRGALGGGLARLPHLAVLRLRCRAARQRGLQSVRRRHRLQAHGDHRAPRQRRPRSLRHAQPRPARLLRSLLPPGAPAAALPLPGQGPRQARARRRRADRATHGAAAQWRLQTHHSAHAAPRLRHPQPGGRHRSARHPDAARSRQHPHHRALRPRQHADHRQGRLAPRLDAIAIPQTDAA